MFQLFLNVLKVFCLDVFLVKGTIFNPKCVLIQFVILNLSLIYFCAIVIVKFNKRCFNFLDQCFLLFFSLLDFIIGCNFLPEMVLIQFVIPNLSMIYFCIPEIIETILKAL